MNLQIYNEIDNTAVQNFELLLTKSWGVLTNLQTWILHRQKAFYPSSQPSKFLLLASKILEEHVLNAGLTEADLQYAALPLLTA